MEQNFASLSKRQTMLLLTALSFGGADAIAAFDHLSLEEEELLKHRAQALLQIPREKRLPVLVQEIKRLFTQRRRTLAAAEPKRLAQLLAAERPAMVEVMLRALPADLAEAVCGNLPGGRPSITLTKEVKPEVLSIIRWKLEEAIKKRAPQVGTFRFTDLLTMPQREVLAICDRMGARVLATAIAGLADSAREAFLGSLPPDQRSLAAKAAEAGRAKRLTESDAKLVLDIHGAHDNPSLGMRSAGAQRIARAAVAQAPEFAQRLMERHPGELGKLLSRWIRDEKGRPVKADGGRLDIVEQMERLAQRGIVDRPVRLPPPMRAPKPLGATGASAAQLDRAGAPARSSSRSLSPIAPLPLRSQPQVARSTSSVPVRRDPIAERQARRAGVAQTQSTPAVAEAGPEAQPATRSPSRTAVRPATRSSSRTAARPATGPGDAESTDPGMSVRREVIQDGEPPSDRDLAPGDPSTTPPRRATAAPAPRAAPRPGEKREGPRPRVLKGSGRGPPDGSG